MRKKEFNDIYHKIVDEDRNASSADGFRDAYRSCLTTFLSPSTQYDRLLIVHGVGTGKTKCAIDICEQSKRVYHKAIILNKGDTATSNFRQQLRQHFTVQGKGVYEVRQEMSYYKLDTYKKFVRYIRDLSEVRIISDYNNSIFIIDEVHNIVTAEHSDDTSVYTTLLNLFDLLPNCIVVGMTATPMRDKYTEIFPLLNMFVKPKNRIIPYPSTTEEFEAQEDKLRQMVRGCVSFYQSNFLFNVVYKGIDYMGLRRHIVPVYMGETQAFGYKSTKDLVDFDEDIGGSVTTFMYKEHTYISLCTFPTGTYSTSVERVVRQVPEESLIHNKNGTTKVLTQVGYEISPTIAEFLRANIHNFSCKFAYIMDIIENTSEYYHRHWYTEEDCMDLVPTSAETDGLVYIFCEDIKETGISTWIALFKLFGYEYYTGGSIDHMSEGRRFTVYVGDNKICSNEDERLEFFRHAKNLTGRYCRIIVASNIMRESVSLRAVRNVFILTPHWNYSSTDQAEGRSVRRNAFEKITDALLRTVNIYRLVAFRDPIDEEGLLDCYKQLCVCNGMNYLENHTVTSEEFRGMMVNNSIDMYKYHRAAMKQVDIDRVMMILQEEAIDRYLNSDIDNFPVYDKLDTSTYSSQSNKLIRDIVTILTGTDLVVVGWLQLDQAIDIIRESLTEIFATDVSSIMDSVLFDAINHIIRQNIPIYDSQSNTMFVKSKSNYLYIVTDPRDSQPNCVFSFVGLKYRTNKMSMYIDKRKYRVSDDVMNRLNVLSKHDFADMVTSKYILNKISILENALLRPDVYARVIDYLSYNVYRCYTLSFDKMLYYHTMDTIYERTTAYSNTTKKVKEEDLVYVCDGNSIQRVSNDMIPELLRRVNVIRKYRDLRMMLMYGVYGSISLIDGAKRIHDNYIKDIDEGRRTEYIHLSDEWILAAEIDKVFSEERYNDALTILTTIQKELVIPGRESGHNPSDNRCQKRGRLINTVQKVDKAMCIYKLISRAIPADSREEVTHSILSILIPSSVLYASHIRDESLTYYDLQGDMLDAVLRCEHLKEHQCYYDALRLYGTLDGEHGNQLRQLLDECDKRILLACGVYDAAMVESILWSIISDYDLYILT
jgi:hypothetical protein